MLLVSFCIRALFYNPQSNSTNSSNVISGWGPFNVKTYFLFVVGFRLKLLNFNKFCEKLFFSISCVCLFVCLFQCQML